MNETKKFSIGELAAAAGISRRAVRFYVQSGVIEPPCGAGRGSYYTDRHLELIRAKRGAYQASPSGTGGRAACAGTAAAVEQVARIRLARGAVLELPAGCGLPDEEQTRALDEIIKGLDTQRRTP